LLNIITAIRDKIRSKKAQILKERIFATQETIETIQHARSKTYTDVVDEVPPSWLVGKEGTLGTFAGF
jgi:hypothetical protein